MAVRYPEFEPGQQNGAAPNKIIYPSRKVNGIIKIPNQAGQISTADMLALGLKLPFNKWLTRTVLDLEKFEDLDIDKIRKSVSGLVLDTHGTLYPRGAETIEPAVVEKLREIRAKFDKVCVFPDNGEYSPVFEQLRIPMMKNSPPKPDPRGFERAAYDYLKLKPRQCAAVGDNLLTDGGALQAGMDLILVDPLVGNESFFYKMGRSYARKIKKFHDRLRKKKSQA